MRAGIDLQPVAYLLAATPLARAWVRESGGPPLPAGMFHVGLGDLPGNRDGRGLLPGSTRIRAGSWRTGAASQPPRFPCWTRTSRPRARRPESGPIAQGWHADGPVRWRGRSCLRFLAGGHPGHPPRPGTPPGSRNSRGGPPADGVLPDLRRLPVDRRPSLRFPGGSVPPPGSSCPEDPFDHRPATGRTSHRNGTAGVAYSIWSRNTRVASPSEPRSTKTWTTRTSSA